MLEKIAEYKKFAEITGFRDVHLNDAKEFSKILNSKLPEHCEAQLFDADFVATWQHLYFAAVNALMNIKSGQAVSKSVSVETVLYASAQRQIKKALDIVGVKPYSKNVAVILICEKEESAKSALAVTARLLLATLDESVLELSPAKAALIRKAFDVSDDEITAASTSRSGEQALVDLVLERVALLSTKL